MKSIQESINEAREIEYSIAFSGFKDAEGLPLSVKILVDPAYRKGFEKWLQDEEGNSVAHANSADGKFEL